MGLPQRYNAAETERRWQETWARERIYEFAPNDIRPIFAIDTPPPTVSGELHIGHVYSYVQAEAMARFWRMQGFNVYYPFGFDDNGLPTERYVEKQRGIRARDVGRAAFIAACLEISGEVEDRFETFWKQLGFSVDWRLRYSTIDSVARRTAQWSFLDLNHKGLIERRQAPNPWCIECQTAIAQAEMDDAERTTTLYEIHFALDNGNAHSHSPNDLSSILIATTRPELLPACVAVFVHPDDPRFTRLIGREALVPLVGRRVPIIADAMVDPQKGTGAVMCCTFGDATDVTWWRAHDLPLIPLISHSGALSEAGGHYAGLTLAEARARIIADLRAGGRLAGERQHAQTVRVHERCGTPLEILETRQWFVRVLDAKAALIEAGRNISWHPAHMRTRYEHWVENLGWDWCISRQRFFGVPFPAWHCEQCGATIFADEAQLPVDPLTDTPPHACACGNAALRPDEDVMDTWATSSVSPLIAGRMLDDPALFARLFPMQLRPQAHDIIRTWAFYSVLKAHYHFGTVPWKTLMISGHGLDPSGRSIHKSKGNSPITPTILIERFGADAVRYWACGGHVGADQPINEAEMKQGARLTTKLWNAARLIASQIGEGAQTGQIALDASALLPTDRALLSAVQRLITQATAHFRTYEYAAAREATERLFWSDLCDDYLELVKGRLYDGTAAERAAAQATLYYTLQVILKLFAPIMPHITEEIYAHLFAPHTGERSVHLAAWPTPDEALLDPQAEQVGATISAIAAHVRRYKTAHSIGLGTPFARLHIAISDAPLRNAIAVCAVDIRSITRAQEVALTDQPNATWELIEAGVWVWIDD